MQTIHQGVNTIFSNCQRKTELAGSQLSKAGSFVSRSVLIALSDTRVAMRSACKSSLKKGGRLCS